MAEKYVVRLGYELKEVEVEDGPDGLRVRINDDWDAYQRFHRQCQHRRLYGSALAVPSAIETRVLAQAA